MQPQQDVASTERWVRADGVLWRHSFGELVALGCGAEDQPVRLNSTCAVLWHRLAEAATTAELVSELAARFDAEPEAIGDEVLAVLGHLADLGLVIQR